MSLNNFRVQIASEKAVQWFVTLNFLLERLFRFFINLAMLILTGTVGIRIEKVKLRMPIKENSVDQGIELSCTGDVSPECLLQSCCGILQNDIRKASLSYMLFNFTDTDLMDISYSEVIQLADKKYCFEGVLEGFKIAIVAPTDLVFGTARVWESYMQESVVDTAVFRFLHDARSWVANTVQAEFLGHSD